MYSKPGQGTTFKIFFTVESGRVEKRFFNLTTTMAHGTETIMIVDDDSSMRGLITDSLAPLEYSLMEASCGKEALELCRQAR